MKIHDSIGIQCSVTLDWLTDKQNTAK